MGDETLAFARQLFGLARQGRGGPRGLLDAGADAHLGWPDAVATAAFFADPAPHCAPAESATGGPVVMVQVEPQRSGEAFDVHLRSGRPVP